MTASTLRIDEHGRSSASGVEFPDAPMSSRRRQGGLVNRLVVCEPGAFIASKRCEGDVRQAASQEPDCLGSAFAGAGEFIQVGLAGAEPSWISRRVGF